MIRRTVVVAMLLLLVACTGEPSAQEIVRRAQGAMERLDQAHAVIEVEGMRDGQSLRLVGEGWMDGERSRATVLEASVPEAIGATAVSDGAQGWLYHPEVPTVLTGEEAALAAYAAEQGDPTAQLELSSLTEMVDELLRLTDQTLLGSEQVAGFDAWHLRLTASEEAPPALIAAGGSAELWIAKDNDLPLQLLLDGAGLGSGRITVQSLNLAPTFDGALFTFEPPAGAEVVDVATLLPVPMTLVEARADAPFALLSTAQDSAEAALVEVARVGERYVQHFEGSLGEWTLVQGPMEGQHDGARAPQGDAVTVRGNAGWLWSDTEQGHTLLAWQEAGQSILLSGSLAPDAALRLAESLD